MIARSQASPNRGGIEGAEGDGLREESGNSINLGRVGVAVGRKMFSKIYSVDSLELAKRRNSSALMRACPTRTKQLRQDTPTRKRHRRPAGAGKRRSAAGTSPARRECAARRGCRRQHKTAPCGAQMPLMWSLRQRRTDADCRAPARLALRRARKDTPTRGHSVPESVPSPRLSEKHSA